MKKGMSPRVFRFVLAVALAVSYFVAPSIHAQSGSFSDLNVTGLVSAGAVAVGSGITINASGGNAIGNDSHAEGVNSTALGVYSWAVAIDSTSIGEAYAAGGNSVALNRGYTAPGASFSTAIGDGTYVKYWGSTAIGYWTQADYWCTTALGVFTCAWLPYQTVVGCANIPHTGTDDGYRPVGNDPVFIVGNGDVWSDEGYNSDAFRVYFNGNAWLQGKLSTAGVRTPPSGDLSMGSFTSGPQP